MLKDLLYTGVCFRMLSKSDLIYQYSYREIPRRAQEDPTIEIIYIYFLGIWKCTYMYKCICIAFVLNLH